MPITTVASTIAALRGSIELAKSAIETMDKLKMAEAQQVMNDRVIDVQNAALELQEKQSAARDEIDNLKDQLRDAKATIEKLESEKSLRAEYRLAELTRGAFAYAAIQSPITEDLESKPSHFICQPCFDGPQNRKSVLIHKPGSQYFVGSWRCPVCSSEITERK